MFQRLLAKLVSTQVISLGVSCGCGFMCVGCKVVQLCGSTVCALWHGGLLYGAVSHRECGSGQTYRRSREAANGTRGLGLHWNLLLQL